MNQKSTQELTNQDVTFSIRLQSSSIIFSSPPYDPSAKQFIQGWHLQLIPQKPQTPLAAEKPDYWCYFDHSFLSFPCIWWCSLIWNLYMSSLDWVSFIGVIFNCTFLGTYTYHILTCMNAEITVEEDEEQEKLSRRAHYIHAFYFLEVHWHCYTQYDFTAFCWNDMK